MKVLGLETSGNLGGFAVVEDGRLLAEITSDITGRHVEQGAAMIERVLELSGTAVGDLAGVAVSLGPGSFTGLRVGLSLAKGLCFGRDLPLVGVPTLDCIAEGVAYFEGLVVPVKDARRGEIYFAFYEAGGGGATRVSAYEALPPDRLAEVIERALLAHSGRGAARPDVPALLVGDALAKYGEALRARLKVCMIPAPEIYWPARSAVVAAMGGRWLAEGRTADLGALEPIYVRLSEAERAAERKVGRKPAGA
ncbi:MAG: tRNA (adenosine(37)-N6)-threonylcarbamoyltransferase complex dimerization subunit type 1 TsaB [bacterium]